MFVSSLYFANLPKNFKEKIANRARNLKAAVHNSLQCRGATEQLKELANYIHVGTEGNLLTHFPGSAHRRTSPHQCCAKALIRVNL